MKKWSKGQMSRSILWWVLGGLMACAAMAAGQVNIEKMRGAETPDGAAAEFKVDLSLKEGNARVRQVDMALRGEYGGAQGWGLMLVQGDFGWSDGRRFSNDGLVHLRQVWGWRPGAWLEGYGQVDYDLSRALAFRGLVGGGLRLRLYAKGKTTLGWGTGYMLEREHLDGPSPAGQDRRVWAHRWNNYITVRWAFSETARLLWTSYAQPRFDLPRDTRLLVDGRLGADVGTRVGLVMTVKLRYDSQPPTGIEGVDLGVKSGIVLSFD